MSPRPYLELFLPLLGNPDIRRAVVLMGPRRVGKTVLLHHAIQALLKQGVDPTRIVYFSVDHPLYNGLSLEELLLRYQEATGTPLTEPGSFVFFDEIQYLRDWEIHLKSLVDSYPGLRIAASGSAAAALKLKSHESGAGRFTDFLLPPLTFQEYLSLLGREEELVRPSRRRGDFFEATDIEKLNESFMQYLNFGGYPELALSPALQEDPGRFIKSDIIDKVLLRDLPSLYGIQNIQELNYLFTTLAFNTAQQVSLEALSVNSGVAKPTIRKYIEYLEAAFLIRVIHKVDRSAKRFKRATTFKVYLTNPSIRSALFAPLEPGNEAVGALVETAIFAQWFHSTATPLHFANWKNGEIDLVALDANQAPAWLLEVKWSDSYMDRARDLRAVISFCKANRLPNAMLTTRSRHEERQAGELRLTFLPAAEYCYTVGHNLIEGKKTGH